MMRKLLLIVFSIALLTQGCSQSDDFADELFASEKEIVKEDIDFPKHIEAFGKGVAKEIEVTVGKLNDLNVDYSEIAGSKNFREKFYEDWYNASPTMAKSRASGTVQPIEMAMSTAEFMERYNSLTDVQLDFIRKIISECEKSSSDQDLLDRLIDLNKEIHAQVPEIEQERLLNIIAVLYYGVQKISYLEAQGLMLKTPYNDIKLSKIKTRAPEGEGSLGEGCRKFTAIVWTIAVGEPTLAGEIVASVVSVFIAGVYVYSEVVVCKKKYSDVEYCNEKYNECMAGKDHNAPNSGGWGYSECRRCHEYCLAQGVWDCPRPR